MITHLRDYISRRIGNGKALATSESFSELSSEISTVIRETADIFGSIGNSLSEIDEKTKCLREDCQVLLAAAGGQDDSTQLLFRVAEALESPMNFLSDCLKKHAATQGLMQQSQQSASDLLQMQNSMISSLEPLKFMLVFFKIEASQLSEEDQQTFHSVAEEISHLHVLVEKTFQKNIDNLQSAKSGIAAAEQKAKIENGAQEKVIAEKHAEIKDAIAALKEQIETNSQKTADLDQSADNFEGAIGRLVMSLQYEDIIRQRCETIEAEIKTRREGLSEQAWLLVLASQIETAAEEMRQSSGELKIGLRSIATQADTLYQSSTTMDQFEHITASADGMVQTLLESLESMRNMLERSTALSQNSHEAIVPVQDLTKELSAIVFEVSIKIQFIALNAQVRSIQVGEGSGLEVLAARTAEISTSLRDLGDATSNKIELLHKSISALVQTINEEWDGGKTQLARINEHGPALESDLHGLRDKTFRSLEIVASLSEMVSGFSERDGNRLESLRLRIDALEGHARRLRTQANIENLSAARQQRIQAEVAAALEETSGAMHTRVHSAASEGDAFDLGIDSKLQARSQSSQSLSCDNVELF